MHLLPNFGSFQAYAGRRRLFPERRAVRMMIAAQPFAWGAFTGQRNLPGAAAATSPSRLSRHKPTNCDS